MPLRTKIVCTIGPASADPKVLREMVAAGMDVARINFSHGGREQHLAYMQDVRAASHAMGRPVALLADLQGPKLRVGQIAGGQMELRAGTVVTLTTRPVEGKGDLIPVQYRHLPQAVRPGDHILIDDGLLELEVLETSDEEIRCRVLVGGPLGSNKGMNLPRAATSIPAITEKDREDLRFAMEHGADWVALSFVRTPQEVRELKKLIQQNSLLGRPTPVIAKIEKPEALDNIDAIIEASDGIMVARGDLGVETSPETVPMVQKAIIAKCNQAGKPVITATQMLDSMIRNPRPTRAEASDVANAILDGTDAIMLSGETAVGRYPVEAVRTMVRIAEEAERSTAAPARCPLLAPPQAADGDITHAVCHASRITAEDLGASAIITPTVSGRTARVMSHFRPRPPIIAVTPSPMVQRQLCLFWGVIPLLGPRSNTTDDIISNAVELALRYGLIQRGDLVVITAGSAGSAPGTTDIMKVHLVEKVLGQGTGLGDKVVRGRVRRLEGPLPPRLRLDPDEIAVASRTDRTFVEALQRAGGLIVAEGGMDSHGALLAVELGIPAIIGVGEEAIGHLQDGQEVTLDAPRGLIYEHHT
ncbi:MAG: pyruvate kinase [Anaerolineae bacterium]|nr:pyruvate kinase [Anaerolineae bacterium]